MVKERCLEKRKRWPHGLKKAEFYESVWGSHYGEYTSLHWLLILWIIISLLVIGLKIMGHLNI
jgi:hypothetical protein